MCRSRAYVRMYSAEYKCLKFYGIPEREKYTNDKQQSKWNKAFWARGYYVATVGNVTEDAIKKYIQEQSEEPWKKVKEPPF